jgi:hypothetical protein
MTGPARTPFALGKSSESSECRLGSGRVTAFELERAIAFGRHGNDCPEMMPARLHSLSAEYQRAYILALDHDANVIARSPGVRVLRRLPGAIVVETDLALAIALSEAGEYVAVYDSAVEALLAVALFDAWPYHSPRRRSIDR